MGGGGEVAGEELEDLVLVEVGLGLEVEGVQGLEDGEASLAQPTLDAALATLADLEGGDVGQKRRVRLALGLGLLDEPAPLLRDAGQAQRLEVGDEVCGLGQPEPTMPAAAQCLLASPRLAYHSEAETRWQVACQLRRESGKPRKC